MNLVMIDLKQHNHRKLKEIALHFDWREEVLLMFKDNEISKIWVDIDTKDVIAFTSKKNPEIQIGHEFSEKLSEMTSFNLPKKQPVLTLDSILDKISKFGVSSLSQVEKDFLRDIDK